MRPAPRKTRAKSNRRRGRPNTINGTVPPRLLPYSKRRQREYLTVKEIGVLMDTARARGRYGHRDATMILVGYRHGLRAAELCALRWDQVDLGRGLFTCGGCFGRQFNRSDGGRRYDKRDTPADRARFSLLAGTYGPAGGAAPQGYLRRNRRSGICVDQRYSPLCRVGRCSIASRRHVMLERAFELSSITAHARAQGPQRGRARERTNMKRRVVPRKGFEPPTPALRMRCSTS